MPTDLGKELLRVREALGLSQRAFADRFGLSLRTLLRIEKGQAEPRGVTKRTFEQALTEARKLLVPNGTISEGQQESENPSQTPSGEAAQAEIQETDLLIQEFGAWLRRTVMRRPGTLEQVSSGVRRLINEVEGVSEASDTVAEQNKASPGRKVRGSAGVGG